MEEDNKKLIPRKPTELAVQRPGASQILEKIVDDSLNIGLSQMIEISELDVSGKGLKLLDLSPYPNLVKLDCSNNELDNLDLSCVPNLESLQCNNNNLKELDLSHTQNLSFLSLNKNKLSKLVLTDTPRLIGLACHENQLSELNLSLLPRLHLLYSSRNQLNSLDLSGNPRLRRLSCRENLLSELNLSHNPELRILNCSGNQLTKLDLSYTSGIRDLDCGKNHLTELDLSKNPELFNLWCDSNRLTELDLSCNPDLTVVDYRDNPLYKPDFGKPKELNAAQGMLITTALALNMLPSIVLTEIKENWQKPPSSEANQFYSLLDNMKIPHLDIEGFTQITKLVDQFLDFLDDDYSILRVVEELGIELNQRDKLLLITRDRRVLKEVHETDTEEEYLKILGGMSREVGEGFDQEKYENARLERLEPRGSKNSNDKIPND